MNTNERNIAVSVPSGELHEALAGTPGIDLIAWDCDGRTCQFSCQPQQSTLHV